MPLTDGMLLRVGSVKARAVHTPGHTPGSTCLLVDGGTRPLLVSGDTLFASGGTGRCDLPGGSRPLAEKSLHSVLAPLDDETLVLPGHGTTTTVGRERAFREARSITFPALSGGLGGRGSSGA